MPSDTLDYSSLPTPRRPTDWLRFAPLLAFLSAGFAWLKSGEYHAQGQLRDEQLETLVLVVFSLACLIASIARRWGNRSGRHGRIVGITALSGFVLLSDALAVWNLTTATMGLKDRLF